MTRVNRLLLLSAAVVAVATAGPNLFQNSGFEQPSGWMCTSCTGSASDDFKEGFKSYSVSNRTHAWSSFTQVVPITENGYYYFKVWVKLLNAVSATGHHEIFAMVHIKKAEGKNEYKQIGKTDFVYAGDRWYLVGGDQYLSSDTESVRLYLKIDEISINYLVDEASMDKVDHLSDFVSDADTRIEQIRKADISVRITGVADPSNLEVELKQIKSEFGWGSAVDAKMMVNPDYQAYQEFFYDLFEWGVLSNAIKWYSIERHQDQFDYDKPKAAIDVMKARNIKMRGHTMVWGVEKHVPYWQKTLSKQELIDKLTEHVGEMTRMFGGNFSHWDVYNENIHGRYYEDKLDYKYVAHRLFEEIRRLDPEATCFMNDFNVISNSASTMAYVDQAIWYRDSGVPVQGLGLQGHFSDFVHIPSVKRRLDEVAAVGIPIWITELDITEPEENSKAEKYESLLRLFFSHPAVKGVVFWGFWEGRHWRPDAAIATGSDVTPNAAGIKVQQLIKETWRTSEKKVINLGDHYNTRGFKGVYALKIRHNGAEIRQPRYFKLSQNVSININLEGTNDQPTVRYIKIE